MGSLPNLSILKGDQKLHRIDCLNRLFEEIAHDDKTKNNYAILYEFNEHGDENQMVKYTYDELNRMANKMARVILNRVHENEIPANTDGDYIVAVSMMPTDRLLVSLLAILKTGAAYLPLEPTFPENRTRHILNEAKPVMVIYEGDNDVFEGTHSISFESLLNESKEMSSETIPNEEILRHRQGDLAIVMYTSGSTGIPKGVRLPHEVIMNRLSWQWEEFPYSSTEQVGVFKTALTFVDHISEVWGPLLRGLTVLVIPKKVTQDPQRLVRVLTDYKIERLVLVPSLLRSMLMYLNLQNDESLLKSLKIWVCSGEPLAVSLAEEFFVHFADDNKILCNFYGSTEIMGDVTYHVLSNVDDLKDLEKVPIGRPLDNTVIYLLDADLRPVPIESVGELYVSGLNLAAGYVNGRDPDRFINNQLAIDPQYARLYKTGDYAKIVKDTLIYEGRTDSQVKIRGHRVDLSEVEKAVTSLNSVDKGVVLCYRPGEIDQALLAFVTSKSDCTLTGLQVESNLQNVLAGYMVPQVIVIDNIPLLVNGKTDRQALLKMYENTNNNDDSELVLDIDYTGVPEKKMDAARVLFETVGSVIGRSTRSTLSLKSNFYHLGGNSLNSIYTVTKLKEHGYIIGITDFLKAENLGELLDKMYTECEISEDKDEELSKGYTMDYLSQEHKADVYEMITSSFYEKADLEQWLMPDIHIEDYTDLMDKIWEPLVEKGFSFVVYNESGEAIGTALNFDARDEPEVEIDSKISLVFELLEAVEGPVRDSRLPGGKGTVLHSFMMGTQPSLSPQENVAVMQAMENFVLKVAQEKRFVGIFTTNTSPLTQQLATDVYGYETMLDYQVNEFIASDKSKPFGNAPDWQRAIVAWKTV